MWYGHDPAAPLPIDDGLSTVELSSIESPLTINQEHNLSLYIYPCAESDSFGINIFMDALQILHNS